jgi:hypothetical protein
MVLLQKSQNQSHFLCFACTCEHFWNPSCTKLVMAWPNCDNFTENSVWNLWKFTQNFCNCESPSFTNFLIDSFWTRSSLTIDGWPLHYLWWTPLS